jgi:coenzyme Q-binding protein COQ10
MPKFLDTRILPYNSSQLAELILDIANYPKFLPWCAAARIVEQNNDFMLADLVIQYKGFTEKYRSKVTHNINNENHFIDVVMVEGPFTHLINKWTLLPIDNGTKVEFFIDFSFKSFFLEKIIGLMFEQASQKMINAFQKRAEELYGP